MIGVEDSVTRDVLVELEVEADVRALVSLDEVHQLRYVLHPVAVDAADGRVVELLISDV
jgi:hypothetical protein